MDPIKVYGTGWCQDTIRTVRQLKLLHIPYEYIDIEQDPAAEEWVRQHNHGEVKRPTIDMNGTILSQPTNVEMEDALRKANLLRNN